MQMINKEIKIETIKDYIYSQNFSLEIYNNHINIISSNGIYLIISKSIELT